MNWIEEVKKYLEDKGIEVDSIGEEDIEICEATLYQLGEMYDWFKSKYLLHIEFVLSGGIQYAFRITLEKEQP